MQRAAQSAQNGAQDTWPMSGFCRFRLLGSVAAAKKTQHRTTEPEHPCKDTPKKNLEKKCPPTGVYVCEKQPRVMHSSGSLTSIGIVGNFPNGFGGVLLTPRLR